MKNDTKLKLLISELELFAENIPEKSDNKLMTQWHNELDNIISKYKPNDNYHIVHLYFTTCTLAEAITEVNIMLKRTPYELIDEFNCIDTTKAEVEDDWFEDYNFTFHTCISDTIENIHKMLNDAGLSFEIME